MGKPKKVAGGAPGVPLPSFVPDGNVEVEVDERSGVVKAQMTVDSTPIDELNYEEKKLIGKGFSKDGSMRKIANIDTAVLMALYHNGDGDAIDYVDSQGTNPWALKKLLHRFPEWRCSEGRV